jgi:acetolactate synthase I/II/III large subunit
MKGADVIADILKREGTEFLSCYPRNPVIEACAAIDIRTILCRQERIGVGIADGFSRMRRGEQNGVFAAQQGPGIENAYAGVAQAYAENVPVLVIPAGHDAARQSVRPTFRAAESFASVTKWSAYVTDVQEIPHALRRAYQAMRSGKPGPVLVEFATSVYEADFLGALDYRAVPRVRSAPDPIAVKHAVKLLLAAKHPIIWAGQGIHYAQAAEQLTTLAELIPAPVAATNPGKSAIAENHPLALGASTRSRPKMYATEMAKADVILAIGSSLTLTPFGPTVPVGRTLIHSTNDASDINKDWRCDEALVGDAALVIEALIDEIDRQRPKASPSKLKSLKETIAAEKKAWQAEWAAEFNSDEVPINQYRVIRDLMQTVDRDNVIVTHDSGSPREQVLPMWETTRAGSYMGWGKSTQLGYGLGLVMGAKLASPSSLCVNFMGDASFGMSGMDIETAARNRIGIITVVFNNAVMACERHVLETSTAKYGALDIGGNYAKVAEGLNVAARRVDKPGDLVGAIQEGVAITEKGQPFLLEVVAKEGYKFSRYEY